MSYNLCYIILLLLPAVFAQAESLSQEVSFEKIDLQVEYRQGNKISLIEAFQSNRTSKLLKYYTRNSSLNSQTIAELEWYSIGRPMLITSSAPPTTISTSTFTWNAKGFHILIDFLSQDQKRLFVERVRSKYGVSVDSSQIVVLRPNRLECSIELTCDHRMIRITGSAAIGDFREYPVRVEFASAYKSIERICLEMSLIENHELEIKCEIEKYSIRPEIKQIFFSLTSSQMDRLLEKLFNNHDWVYISRKQLKMFSEEVYRLFNIEYEYKLTKDEFTEKFLEELDNLTSFKHVEFKEGLRSLSRYEIDDLDVDQTVKDFANLINAYDTFVSEQIYTDSDGKEHWMIIDYDYNYFKIRINPSFNVNSTVSKLFGNLTVQFINQSYIDTDHNEYKLIIDSINNHTYEEIRWKYESLRKILPESLNLTLLRRNHFEKGIQIKISKTVLNDSVYKRVFTFRTEGNPKEIYTTISNKVINSSLAKVLGVLDNVNSLSDCFSYCNERTRCYYVEIVSKKQCRFYDKSAYLGLRESLFDSRDNDRHSFYRKRFLKQVKDGYRLTNAHHLKSPIKHLKSEEECWERCLVETLCFAISFNYTNSYCFLFRKSVYNLTSDDEFMSILYVDTQTNSRNEAKTSEHANVKFTNYFKSSVQKSESDCWDACLKETSCVAVSFRGQNKKCLLFESGQYLATRDTSYSSVSFESESSYINRKLQESRQTNANDNSS